MSETEKLQMQAGVMRGALQYISAAEEYFYYKGSPSIMPRLKPEFQHMKLFVETLFSVVKTALEADKQIEKEDAI